MKKEKSIIENSVTAYINSVINFDVDNMAALSGILSACEKPETEQLIAVTWITENGLLTTIVGQEQKSKEQLKKEETARKASRTRQAKKNIKEFKTAISKGTSALHDYVQNSCKGSDKDKANKAVQVSNDYISYNEHIADNIEHVTINSAYTDKASANGSSLNLNAVDRLACFYDLPDMETPLVSYGTVIDNSVTSDTIGLVSLDKSQNELNVIQSRTLALACEYEQLKRDRKAFRSLPENKLSYKEDKRYIAMGNRMDEIKKQSEHDAVLSDLLEHGMTTISHVGVKGNSALGIDSKRVQIETVNDFIYMLANVPDSVYMLASALIQAQAHKHVNKPWIASLYAIGKPEHDTAVNRLVSDMYFRAIELDKGMPFIELLVRRELRLVTKYILVSKDSNKPFNDMLFSTVKELRQYIKTNNIDCSNLKYTECEIEKMYYFSNTYNTLYTLYKEEHRAHRRVTVDRDSARHEALVSYAPLTACDNIRLFDVSDPCNVACDTVTVNRIYGKASATQRKYMRMYAQGYTFKEIAFACGKKGESTVRNSLKRLASVEFWK